MRRDLSEVPDFSSPGLLSALSAPILRAVVGGQRFPWWLIAGAVALSLGVLAVVLLLALPDDPGDSSMSRTTQSIDEPAPGQTTNTVAGPIIDLSQENPRATGEFLVDANEVVRGAGAAGSIKLRVIPDSADVSPAILVRVYPTDGGPGTEIVDRVVGGDPISISFPVAWPQRFTYRLELAEPQGIGGGITLRAVSSATFDTTPPEDAQLAVEFGRPDLDPAPGDVQSSNRETLTFAEDEAVAVRTVVVVTPPGYFDPTHTLALQVAGSGVTVEAIAASPPRTSTLATPSGPSMLSAPLPGPPVDCSGPEPCRSVYWIAFVDDAALEPLEWWIESTGATPPGDIILSSQSPPHVSTKGFGTSGEIQAVDLTISGESPGTMAALLWPSGNIVGAGDGIAVVEVGGGSVTEVSGGEAVSWALLCADACITDLNVILRRSLGGESSFDPTAVRPQIEWTLDAYIVTVTGDPVPDTVALSMGPS